MKDVVVKSSSYTASTSTTVDESRFRMTIIRETIIRYMSIVAIHKYTQHDMWDLPIRSLSRLSAEDIQDIVSCITSPLSAYSCGEVYVPYCESPDWIFNMLILVIRWAGISQRELSDSDDSMISNQAVISPISGKRIVYVDESLRGRWSKKRLLSAQQILRDHVMNFVVQSARQMHDLYPMPSARDIKRFTGALDIHMPQKVKRYLSGSIGDVLNSLFD
jgi:hypothetical protein